MLNNVNKSIKNVFLFNEKNILQFEAAGMFQK